MFRYSSSSNIESYGQWVIWTSIFVSLLLTISPIPWQLELFRPNWAVLVIAYWVLALPHRINIGIAWLIGLILDLLLGYALGIQAFVMALMAYTIASYFRLIRNTSLVLQILLIGVIDFCYQIIVLFAQQLTAGRASFDYSCLWSILITMIMWPCIFCILRKLRRKFKVN